MTQPRLQQVARPLQVLQRRVTWILLACLLVSGLPQRLEAADKAQLQQLLEKPHQKGILIRFKGPIGLMLPRFLKMQLRRAKRAGADLVVIEIDSPGGEVEASFTCADLLKTVDWADLVVYVPKEAISGAAITAFGSKTIVMAPEARIGDVGVIFMDEKGMFQHVPEKIRSVVVVRICELARATGRPETLVHAMVDKDWVVYQVTKRDSNEEKWMSEEEIEEANRKEPGLWEKGEKVPGSREGYFLTLTGEQAVALNLADHLCVDREQLGKDLHLADPWIVVSPTWVDYTVIFLSFPLVTGLLFVIGIIALFVEFSAPGISVGGLTAGLCFVLFFWSRFFGGTAGWLEVLLFILGILFLLAELYLIPGFGVAGLGGCGLIIASVWMACQTHFIPHTETEWAETMEWGVVISVSTVVCIAAAWGLIRYLDDIPVLRRFALTPPVLDETPLPVARLTATKAGHSDPEPDDPRSVQPASVEGICVGDQGTVESPLRPSGKMAVGAQLVDVVTDGEFVEAGERVQVVEIKGNRIVVRSLRSMSGD